VPLPRQPLELETTEASPESFAELAQIPISFRVTCVLDVAGPDGAGAFALSERVLDAPYFKDYDAIDGEGPTTWPRRFDVARWGVIFARSAGRAVGAAVIAFDTPGVTMLEGRADLAVLWDLRVAPDARGLRIGSALFRAAEAWARARGCTQLKVETQNVNVPACRFYVSQGCVLGGADRHAYPALPGEIQLLWYRDLTIPLPT
jgi:GNAT superfamily N-acetyltransferase